MKKFLAPLILTGFLMTGCESARGDDDCVDRVTRVEVDDSFCNGGSGFVWVPDGEGIDFDKRKKVTPLKPVVPAGPKPVAPMAPVAPRAPVKVPAVRR